MSVPAASASKSREVTEIERLGYKWHEEAQYDITRTGPDRRVQARETAHYAPRQNVEMYSVQMKQSQFPPIVVTSDDWIIDGNTRIGALQQNGDKFFPAIVVEVDYLSPRTTDRQKYELNALAATLNNLGAQRLTPPENRNAAKPLIKLGWKPEQIARVIGLKPSSVAQVRKEIEAEDRLRKVGLDIGTDSKSERKVEAPSLRALGSREALMLNDAPYRELAILADDAGMNAGEIVSAAKEAKETGSDAAASALLSRMRNEFTARIRTKELTGSGKPTTSGRLRQSLGSVIKFEGREQELIETDTHAAANHLTLLDRAIAILTAVRDLQEVPEDAQDNLREEAA